MLNHQIDIECQLPWFQSEYKGKSIYVLHLKSWNLFYRNYLFYFYIDIVLYVTTMRSYIKGVFTQNFERLQNTSRYSINSLADKMFTNSLISDDHFRISLNWWNYSENKFNKQFCELLNNWGTFIIACTDMADPIKSPLK